MALRHLPALRDRGQRETATPDRDWGGIDGDKRSMEPCDTPEVSAVIPVCNGQRFVADAIRSVLAQPPRVELIVVDDGSTDGTVDVVAAFGDAVRLIRSPRNEGLPSALNRGVAAVSSRYVGFLDADDLWTPNRLPGETLMLAEHPEVAALWGRTRVVFLSGDDQPAAESPEWPPQFFPSLAAMLFRREVFERVGYFDPALRHAQDIDFLARFSEAGLRFWQHQDIVLTWRRHEENMTNMVARDRDYFATAVRNALHRRRSLS
jgi:glycosyltransferase involved in cell wall biosynthesis